MSSMNLFPGPMIAFEVLVKMNEMPERFDFSERSGWSNLYVLTTTVTNKNTKSLKGAFEQASLIGFCLASDWAKKNKAFMHKDEYKSVSDLLKIYNFLSHKKLLEVKKFKAETKMNAAILEGFHHGYKLALVYSKHQQRLLNSGAKRCSNRGPGVLYLQKSRKMLEKQR